MGRETRALASPFFDPYLDGRDSDKYRVAMSRYDPNMPFVVRILLGWAVDAAALALAAWIFTGISVGGSAGTLIFAALVYGILATFVKPVLKLLTVPLAILTLGIAWFFVAMFILWLTDVIVSGMHINGFWDLVGGTIVVWAVGVVADFWLFPKKRVGRN